MNFVYLFTQTMLAAGTFIGLLTVISTEQAVPFFRQGRRPMIARLFLIGFYGTFLSGTILSVQNHLDGGALDFDATAAAIKQATSWALIGRLAWLGRSRLIHRHDLVNRIQEERARKALAKRGRLPTA